MKIRVKRNRITALAIDPVQVVTLQSRSLTLHNGLTSPLIPVTIGISILAQYFILTACIPSAAIGLLPAARCGVIVINNVLADTGAFTAV